MNAGQKAVLYEIIGTSHDGEPPDGRLRLAAARARVREWNIRARIRRGIAADVARLDGRAVQGQASGGPRPAQGTPGPAPGTPGALRAA